MTTPVAAPARPLITVRTLVATLVALLLVIAALATWWQQHRSASPVVSGPVIRLTTGFIGEYASLVLVAQEQGYFRKAGLDVTLRPYSSGPAAIAELKAGRLDMALGSDFAGVRNSFAGEDLRILATVSRSEAFDLVARRDHGIKAIGDLRGKRIGVTRQTVGEFYLGQFLTFNHLALSDVAIVDQPQNELVTGVTNGQLDAAVVFEPNAYAARKALGQNATRWSVQSGQSIYTLLYTTNRFLRSQPEAAKRYLQALLWAEQYVAGHDRAARQFVAKRLDYDQAYLDEIWPKFSFHVSLDQELLLNMDDEARWTVENQLTTTTELPNYFRMLYLPALEALKPEAITVIH